MRVRTNPSLRIYVSTNVLHLSTVLEYNRSSWFSSAGDGGRSLQDWRYAGPQPQGMHTPSGEGGGTHSLRGGGRHSASGEGGGTHCVVVTCISLTFLRVHLHGGLPSTHALPDLQD